MKGESSEGLSLAYRWLDVAQEATAREVDRNAPRPTVIARTLAIWATSMYDAWAAYDEKAVGSRLGAGLRRPGSERTLANKKKAISYAACHALLYVYPEDKAYLDEQMRAAGYDPAVVSDDPALPEGIGHLAAAAVIAYRRHDGANQHRDEAGGDGTAYGDYTFYRPVNPPDRIIDPDRWQPITFTLDNGTKVTPGFLTPPFPGYTSGHATVSGACAKMLELYTGSDDYGFLERRRHCELTETKGGDLVDLDLPTFSSVAEMAALSRALGGYHIPVDNTVGLKAGRELAVWSWPKYQAYFDGTGVIRDDRDSKSD